MRKLAVCHLAAHIGGGVGSVLGDFFKSSAAKAANHHLMCFDSCTNNFPNLSGVISKVDSLFPVTPDLKLLFEEAFDVVVLHYWNHPLTAAVLVQGLPNGRFLIWNHNSGFAEPHVIPSYLINGEHPVCFSSRCSIHSKSVAVANPRPESKLHIIHSTRNLADFQQVGGERSRRKRDRRLIYVGTVSDSKLHTEAPSLFAALSRQGFEITVVGGPYAAQLASEVKLRGGTCIAVGHVDDPLPYFKDSDIFVYPLRPDHYGTGEQVMLEALASGLPIVAFNNPAEAAIVDHGISGLLANSTEEFLTHVFEIGNDDLLYETLSQGAVRAAESRFDYAKMSQSLMNVIESTANNQKSSLTAQIEFDGADVGLAAFALNSFFDPQVFN